MALVREIELKTVLSFVKKFFKKGIVRRVYLNIEYENGEEHLLHLSRR